MKDVVVVMCFLGIYSCRKSHNKWRTWDMLRDKVGDVSIPTVVWRTWDILRNHRLLENSRMLFLVATLGIWAILG